MATQSGVRFTLVGIRNLDGGRFAVYKSYSGAIYAMPWERHLFLCRPGALSVAIHEGLCEVVL